MKKIVSYTLLLLSFLLSAGNAPLHPAPAEIRNNVIKKTVKIGVSARRIADPAASSLWEKVPAYGFLHNVTDARHINLIPSERACVRYLCDPENLFVRVDAQDQDIMTCASANHQFHYQMGDLVEVFIKPADQHYYWEFYGTPNGYFSCFHYKSAGSRLLPSSFVPLKTEIKILNRIDGTFNDHSDRDRMWQVIIAIPRQELEKHGYSFSSAGCWTLLTTRYNYGRYISYNERSSYPQVANGYHATRHYADVEFIDLDRKEK